MVNKKAKSIIFFLMIVYSLSMIAHGNTDLSINDNLISWVLFGLINFLYWSFKALMTVLSIWLGEDENQIFSQTPPKFKDKNYDNTSNAYNVTSTTNHNDYMPHDNVYVNKRDIKVCESVKLQNGIKIVSIDDKLKNKKK